MDMDTPQPPLGHGQFQATVVRKEESSGLSRFVFFFHRAPPVICNNIDALDIGSNAVELLL
jgi:hypothetical protein